MRRADLLVLSPHLDDAVFACGDLIAAHPESLVVTVFTAGPASEDRSLRRWDAECGFRAGDPVMRVRRGEDLAALSVLGARPIWLPFRDAQYRGNGDPGDVSTVLDRVLDVLRPSTVAGPLGIFHNDHIATARAALAVRDRHPRVTWLVYADAIYRQFPEDPVGARVAGLRAAGVGVERAQLGGFPASPVKRRAVAAYRSQLRGLVSGGRAGYADVFEPEVYWRLR